MATYKNFLVPSKKQAIHNPFGPCLGTAWMSDKLVQQLLKCLEKVNADPDTEDNGKDLAGEIAKQPKMPVPEINAILEELGPFIDHFFQQAYKVGTLGHKKISETLHGIERLGGWFVDQKAGEYNPTHLHPEVQLSCVGYLSLPEQLQGFDPIENTELDGGIQFSYGWPTANACSNFMITPQVGLFIIFPGSLQHTVYPFQGEGRRISFSINMRLAYK